MNILLVDDEKYILEELCDVVEEVLPNAARHPVSNAEKALEFAKTNVIDIAFVDINLVGINGLTLAKKLQNIHPEINIIFCTGYSEYALNAVELFCTAYLMKPITTEKVKKALDHLRYPVDQRANIVIHCFGNFEIYCQSTPIAFKYNKTKELLAYLVDRNGADCTTREIIAAIFDDDNKLSYFSNLRRDLLSTLSEFGISDIIRQSKGRLGIERKIVSCDYFDFLDGKNKAFHGEYMTQYSFAEPTCAALNKL